MITDDSAVPPPAFGPDSREETEHEQQEILSPGEIAVGVILGRTSEFFDFFTFAIASVLVFPRLVFPFTDPLQGTLYSFAIFALTFIARPIGTTLFMAVERNYGRATKLISALFLLGSSTVAVAFLPSYDEAKQISIVFLALFQIGQGLALGGVWDGLPSLLSMNVPDEKRGWYAMIPQLGAPLGLVVASGLFAFFALNLAPSDFFAWGWRYPFFVAFAINVVALFARVRIATAPQYALQFQSRELKPTPVGETLKHQWRNITIGALAPLASFTLFHMVTVFPLAWIFLFTLQSPAHFLVIECFAAAVGTVSIVCSGVIADKVGRRKLLSVTALAIAAYSGYAPQLLNGGDVSVGVYMVLGFALLGLSFGQASGALASNFPNTFRYTGSAITTDLSWLLGAGFAPYIALQLSSHFGLTAGGAYLLSGALCTLGALALNAGRITREL